jgi:Protein NO VEIN, C-terminal
VHSPEAIRLAEEASPVAQSVLADLEAERVSRLYPGFDILTIAAGEPDRLIELKSSGVDAKVAGMSWNEWKTARQSHLRKAYWLYVVGNLRADLQGARPYVRAIQDPFSTLIADEIQQRTVRRAVQLRVREFGEAEHLDLEVASARSSTPESAEA